MLLPVNIVNICSRAMYNQKSLRYECNESEKGRADCNRNIFYSLFMYLVGRDL